MTLYQKRAFPEERKKTQTCTWHRSHILHRQQYFRKEILLLNSNLILIREHWSIQIRILESKPSETSYFQRFSAVETLSCYGRLTFIFRLFGQIRCWLCPFGTFWGLLGPQTPDTAASRILLGPTVLGPMANGTFKMAFYFKTDGHTMTTFGQKFLCGWFEGDQKSDNRKLEGLMSDIGGVLPNILGNVPRLPPPP